MQRFKAKILFWDFDGNEYAKTAKPSTSLQELQHYMELELASCNHLVRGVLELNNLIYCEIEK